MYDFDELPRGEQKEKLMIIKTIALTADANTKENLQALYKVSKDDIVSILASRRLWNGYQYFNALLRPEKGLSYNTQKIALVKSQIERLL